MDQQNRAARKKYHVIYKTTCLITNRYYIGMHSTDKLDDGYMGSGKRLWSSLKKHGIKNHVYEIQEYLPTRDAVKQREAELVNEKLLEDKQCMNLTTGGGWEYFNATLSSERRSELGKLGGFANKHKWSEETRIRVKCALRENSSRTLRKQWLENREQKLETVRKAQIFAQSVEAREKRKATFKVIGHQQGSANSQFGKCWIHKDGNSFTIKKEELDKYLTLGYAKGRKMPL